jgi:hypothetical protein
MIMCMPDWSVLCKLKLQQKIDIYKKKDGDETDREMDREHGVMSLLAGTSQRTGAFCPASSQIMHGHIPHMESIDPFA